MNLNTSAACAATQPSFIQANIPLREKNWFKTGGNAQWFCEPQTALEFQAAVQWAATNKMPVTVIGEGANILISDDGIQGLVIIPALRDMQHTNTAIVTAGAGTSLSTLIEYCLTNNIVGLEEFSGIPGTIGGSVYINVHYFQFLLSQFLISATIICKNTGNLVTVTKDWFAFGYNTSTLHEKNYFLVDATFQLQQVDATETAYARGRRTEIIRHRMQRYPNKNTCGSFFRNFHDNEVTIVSNGRKMIFVAYYLDKIGVKGALAVGGAAVSYQHANMLVTNDTATSSDVIQLARTMQTMVHKEFGVMPEAECQFLGFVEHPLLLRS